MILAGEDKQHEIQGEATVGVVENEAELYVMGCI